jgi:NAD+ kinase
MIKSIYLYPNTGKNNAVDMASKLLPFFKSRGIEILVNRETFDNLKGQGVILYTKDRNPQIAVVLGGDGTILRVAHELAGKEIPILGINLGHMGYLTDVEPHEAESTLASVLTGQYTVENRSVLDGILTDFSGEERSFHAFNDFTLHRGGMGGLLYVNVSINHTHMDTFPADGVIACTPSGSTAYNFSAGGPLINPIAQNLIFTPICTHSVFNRSIVLMKEDLLTFETDPTREEPRPHLSVDGLQNIRVDGFCRLDIKISDITFPLIRTKNQGFYKILKEKMFPT